MLRQCRLRGEPGETPKKHMCSSAAPAAKAAPTAADRLGTTLRSRNRTGEVQFSTLAAKIWVNKVVGGLFRT